MNVRLLTEYLQATINITTFKGTLCEVLSRNLPTGDGERAMEQGEPERKQWQDT